MCRPNTERWKGSAFFFYYCYCKQVQTKDSPLDIVGCATVFPANFHFFHLLSTLQGFGFHFPKIDLSFCWVSGFYILVICCACCTVLSLCYVLYLVFRTPEIFDYLSLASWWRLVASTFLCCLNMLQI